MLIPAITTSKTLEAEGEQDLSADRDPRWFFQGLVAAGCVLFGVAMIANTQLANDGAWFWYAVLHHSGKRLYADLHMVVQPLIVLETEGWISLVGKGWVASKVLALVHLLVFVAGIALVNARSRLSDLSKAIVLACVFFVGIHFEYYRFDDYHVIAHIFYLFSMLLLLLLDLGKSGKRELIIAAVLGILAGLCTVTRLPDGAALLCCTALAIVCISRSRRATLLATFLVFASFTIASVVGLTGDSTRSYIAYSVLGAPGPKGGFSSVLVRPLLLPWNSLIYFHRPQLLVLLLTAIVVASWTFLVSSFSRIDLPTSTIKAVAGLVLIAGAVGMVFQLILNGTIIEVLSAVWVLAAFVGALLVIWQTASGLFHADQDSTKKRKRITLLLPFALFLTGAMSTGGVHFGLYAPVAFFILLLPVVFPSAFETRWLRSGFLALAVLMAVSGACFKFMDPASWNNYKTFPMFAERMVVHHPVYGPMVMDKALNQFADGICSDIQAGGGGELLSTPFSYANYYCDIVPWQGFVQTFFDTSGKDSIDQMLAKLSQAPPKWVLYERQLGNLAMHEATYANGKRLPYRELDDFLMDKIYTRQWEVVEEQRYGGDSVWLLLKTQ